MKERPILFSGEMIRALLAGTKTQTRRVVKEWQIPKQQEDGTWFAIAQRDPRYGFGVSGYTEQECAKQLAQYGSPYGNPAAKLWVRETFGDAGCRLTYRADEDDGAHCVVEKWIPSIHMPRAACRLVLEITDIRVERLQDITYGDAQDEGWPPMVDGNPNPYDPITWFKLLWIELYGAGSWDANPYVWRISFKKVEA